MRSELKSLLIHAMLVLSLNKWCGKNYRMKRTNLRTIDISVQLNRQIVVGFLLMKINMAQRKFDMNL